MWFYQRVLRTLRLCILVPVFLVMISLWGGNGIRLDAAVPQEMIRIAITRNSTDVAIDGDGLLVTREGRQPLSLKQPVMIRPRGGEVEAEGVRYSRLTFAAASAVMVNGKPYRGIIEVTGADRGLLVVNELPLEEYLVGLINCEISSTWPIEAIKAQAVIARTYALNRKELRKNAAFHLESTVMDQVYEGILNEDSRARRAVTETEGEVLVYNNAVIQAFYHSNCGGKTEASEHVWGAALPYLKGVDCQYCLTTPVSVWEQRLSFKDMEARLRAAGYKVTTVTGIRPGERNSRGRLKQIIVRTSRGDLALAGDQFRKVMGYGVIKSTNFTMKQLNGEVVFTGMGNGHGVGLCQWGAKQRALDGFAYSEILTYYYPGTDLKKIAEIH